MNDIHEDRQTVYEIGYLISTSVAEENVPTEAEALKKVITDAGAEILAEEAPHRQLLAYTMRTKNVSGSYEKYNAAYFGWVKFELGSSKVEEVKKAIESKPSVLRMLLITTVKENTYLGKRSPALLSKSLAEGEEKKDVVAPRPEAAPASIEEMDKSIDEMVKEV